MKPGRTCTLNYNAGTYAAPTWTHIARVSSPKQTRGRPATRRTYRSHVNSKNVLGMIDAGITFTYVCRASGTDTVLTSLMTSLNSDTNMDIAMLDGPAATGATGIRGQFKVSQMDRNEDDEDAVSYDVTLVEVEASAADETTAGGPINATSFTVP